MKRLRGLPLLMAGLILMSIPAFAADYHFETLAPQDYYGSTSYETVYGAQYNYGGINAVDFLDPLAEGAPVSTATSGGALEYGIQASGGQHYPASAGSAYPVQWDDVSMVPTIQITSAAEVERADGSVGTLVIPSLGIRFKAYEGADSAGHAQRCGAFPQHLRLGRKYRLMWA